MAKTEPDTTSTRELLDFLAANDTEAAQALNESLQFEKQEWVPVFRITGGPDGVLRLCYLVREPDVPQTLHQTGFEFSIGDGSPGLLIGPEETCTYERVGDAVEIPLVIIKTFEGADWPRQVEIAEDFRLYWNLYEDRTSRTFKLIDDNGDEVVVVKVTDHEVLIDKRYLRRYQAIRQLHLVIQVVVDNWGGLELAPFVDENRLVRESLLTVSYYGGAFSLSSDHKFFTRLLAKRVLPPPSIEQSGVYPFETPPVYDDFTIEIDDEGEAVRFTSDPDQLSNYFGANPGAPHYLTPVYFSRDVLDRYYGNPDRYSVYDGAIHGPTFVMRLDNNPTDYVVAFLGDLGRDLPEKERKHWLAHNIRPREGMSDSAVRRSFLGQFAGPDHVEHRFQEAMEALNSQWATRFGATLWKDPNPGDEYIRRNIHVPTNDGFQDFDLAMVRLAKSLVDSLNEAQFKEMLPKAGLPAGGIDRLDRVLTSKGLDGEVLLKSLRATQGMRSRSAAHRKGGDFSADVLLDGFPTLPARFAGLLEDLVDGMDGLREQLVGPTQHTDQCD